MAPSSTCASTSGEIYGIHDCRVEKSTSRNPSPYAYILYLQYELQSPARYSYGTRCWFEPTGGRRHVSHVLHAWGTVPGHDTAHTLFVAPGQCAQCTVASNAAWYQPIGHAQSILCAACSGVHPQCNKFAYTRSETAAAAGSNRRHNASKSSSARMQPALMKPGLA